MFKRYLAILVAVLTAFAVLTTAVWAEELDGSPEPEGDLSLAPAEYIDADDAAAAETTASDSSIIPVSLTVSFLQTDARTELQLLNDFRTGSDAWVWDSSNTSKVYKTDLSDLTWDYELEKVAMQRAVEIALYYAHVRPDNTSCFTAYSDLGYKYNGYCAENLAAGFNSVSDVFRAWQETSQNYAGQGHRRIMLSSKCNRFAAAGVSYNGVCYWVQEFAYASGSNAVTSAVNGSAVRTIELAKDQISAVTLTPSVTNLSFCAAGTAAAVPSFSTGLTTKKYWTYYSKIAPVSAAITTTIADAAVAAISGSSVKAKAAGNTTLTAVSALGASAEVPISVTASHTWDEGTVTQAASCTEDGIKCYTCTVCGATKTETLPATGHDYTAVTEGDHTTYTCSQCGDSYTDGAAAEHEHAYIAQVILPTCTEKGYTLYTCSRCGDSYTADETAASGHSWNAGTVTKAAACSTSGEKTYTCTVCGATRTEAIAAYGHSYTETIAVPTRSSKGCTIHTCSVCGDSYKDNETVQLKSNGWNKLQGVWYYGKNNSAVTGWNTISKTWYYFNAYGVMQTGWQRIDGKWYYLKSSGAMLKGKQKVSGKYYYFGTDGVMRTGWQQISGKYYYFNADGVMQTGWQQIDGKWYYFNSSGSMLTGKQKISKKYYYFGSDGAMQTGWEKIGKYWYYFESSGVMAASKSITLDGVTYRFKSSGVCANP